MKTVRLFYFYYGALVMFIICTLMQFAGAGLLSFYLNTFIRPFIESLTGVMFSILFITFIAKVLAYNRQVDKNKILNTQLDAAKEANTILQSAMYKLGAEKFKYKNKLEQMEVEYYDHNSLVEIARMNFIELENNINKNKLLIRVIATIMSRAGINKGTLWQILRNDVHYGKYSKNSIDKTVKSIMMEVHKNESR